MLNSVNVADGSSVNAEAIELSSMADAPLFPDSAEPIIE
jgi:hypothetical protein